MSEPTLFDDPVGQPRLFEVEAKEQLSLVDRFGVPPFSVLDGRGGQWQERKQAWLNTGIRSELGRDEKLLDMSSLTSADDAPCKTCGGTGTAKGKVTPCKHCKGTGKKFGNRATVHGSTSVFDPVLCELSYRWFCPPGGQVVDPFAGGSVRGITAAILGRPYLGIDLRPEQVVANYEQAELIRPHRKVWAPPLWLEGDSRQLPELYPQAQGCDYVFSCPPYYDLEKYSADPRDLSNAGEYHVFLDSYRDIIGCCAHLLRPDRFACFVVGEVRAKDGSYHGLVPDTIRAFEDHGLRFYNEFILVTPLGTAPVRASSQFPAGRKAVKGHQNVLVFVKGDPKAAAAAVPLSGANASQEGEAWVDQVVVE